MSAGTKPPRLGTVSTTHRSSVTTARVCLTRGAVSLVATLLTACSTAAVPSSAGDSGVGLVQPDTPGVFDRDASVDVPFELGSGRVQWEALPLSGGQTELVHGPQGGYHIWGRVRFRGLEPDVYLSFRVLPVEGGAAINTTWERVRRASQRGLVPFEDGYESASAEFVVMAIPGLPASVVGRRFRWQVAAQEAATGRVAIAEREVTIVDAEP